MKKDDIRRINIDSVSKPVGHYCHVVELNNGIVHLSGQKAWRNGYGTNIVGDIIQQTNQVLDNIEQILFGIELDWTRVTRVHCYLANLEDFSAFDEIFAKRLKNVLPARSTVAGLQLRDGALVEIAIDAFRSK